jgi:hypothetical protein
MLTQHVLDTMLIKLTASHSFTLVLFVHAFDLSHALDTMLIKLTTFFSKSRYFFETDFSSKSRYYSETEGVYDKST